MFLGQNSQHLARCIWRSDDVLIISTQIFVFCFYISVTFIKHAMYLISADCFGQYTARSRVMLYYTVSGSPAYCFKKKIRSLSLQNFAQEFYCVRQVSYLINGCCYFLLLLQTLSLEVEVPRVAKSWCPSDGLGVAHANPCHGMG